MSAAAPALDAFRHEAMFYAGEDELVRRVAGFARDGVRLGEPVLVVLTAAKLEGVRQALGGDATHVQLADMAQVGANPGRIISAWQRFVESNAADGASLRGVGEPIWAGREGDELVECHRHEALLNVAFDRGRPWWLVCPYDTATLPSEVIAEARRNHPWVRRGTVSTGSDTYVDPAAAAPTAPLPSPPRDATVLAFDAVTLPAVRALVARCAARWGFASARVGDAALAVNEVAENSLRHGGGGTLRVWQGDGALVCDLRSSGRVADPLAGRVAPGDGVDSPRGLWLANALCDLVQIRTGEAGTAVRLHLRRRP